MTIAIENPQKQVSHSSNSGHDIKSNNFDIFY